eukprot:14192845-Heterocapsa_arctica.AAC.1
MSGAKSGGQTCRKLPLSSSMRCPGQIAGNFGAALDDAPLPPASWLWTPFRQMPPIVQHLGRRRRSLISLSSSR